MLDHLDDLLTKVELALASLPEVQLNPPASAAMDRELEMALGQAPPRGYVAFIHRHDGGRVGARGRLLTMEQSLAQLRAEVAVQPQRKEHVLWPVMDLAGRRFALQGDAAGAGAEWPVVEVTAGRLDRTATSFLRFLHLLAAEMATPAESDAVALASERCARDPDNADHWIELAEVQEEAEDFTGVARTLERALGTLVTRTPALMLSVGVERLLEGQVDDARVSLREALVLPSFSARDDDSRLDAAALLLVDALRAGEVGRADELRRTVGEASSAVASFWRGEALHAFSHQTDRHRARARLALDLMAALAPDDPDVPLLRAVRPEDSGALRRFRVARELLDRGKPDEAVVEARGAVAELPRLAVSHAVLAESLNASGERTEAAVAARRAVELYPSLVEGWRELGEALLDGVDVRGAEDAFRRVTRLDPTYGLGHAKLAQALLEQHRTLEALEAVTVAAERGGDPFFVAAMRGDVYAEMERHAEAAAAYEEALRFEPEDHWTLHQAALENGLSGREERASDLFEAAIASDRDGCYQTLIDYADLLRRMGRIGDAVRLYRKAVTAVPEDPEWRETLREAERELLSAPN